MMRKITVFGGSGFIGRHLVRRLAHQGWAVRVAVRSPDAAKFLKPLGEPGQIQPWRTDIRDDAAIAAAMAGVDAVVNLVGILFESGRQRFGDLQASGPGRIAAAAQAAGVTRLVHVSAIGADAQSPAAYASSKALGEAAVLAAFPTATILRPSIVIGPEDGFFNRFGAMAMMSPFLPLVGGGRTRFQPVTVGDVADAILASLTRPDVLGRVYELGGPKTYSFRELLELTLRVIGRRRCLLTIPMGVAKLQGMVLQNLPNPPLTLDQVRMLETDNVVAANALGLIELGIDASPIEPLLPSYMDRFRPGSPFARQR